MMKKAKRRRQKKKTDNEVLSELETEDEDRRGRCTQDKNIQHLHDETLTLLIHGHLQLNASQYKQKTQHPSHPHHKHTTNFNTSRLKKKLFLTTAATQQTFPQTPTQSLQ